MLSVSGCRGVVGDTLTPDVAARFAMAFGGFVKERAGGKPVNVVLARDGRAGCGMIHHAATAGLMGAGVSVVDIGVAMTPTAAVVVDDIAARYPGEVSAGLMLTASHNPQQWNGLKCLYAAGPAGGGLFGSGASAPASTDANAIIERFKAGSFLAGSGGAAWNEIRPVTLEDDACNIHVDRVLAALEEGGFGDSSAIGAGLSVAVDSVNAAGVTGSALALESFGIEEFLHLGSEDTGIFPHPPEPTRENLSVVGGLCDSVREAECDVGFAQDPDADRLALVDEKGHYIGEEYTLALCAMAILEARKTLTGDPADALTLVTNLSTSRMLDDVAAKYGARVVRTAVGEANVVEAMKRERAVLGGEGNGGIIWPRVCYVRDSIAGMGLILWLLSPNGGGRGRKRKLSELVAGIPSYAIQKRKVDLASKDQATDAVRRIAAAYASERVDTTDGAWVDFGAKRSWLHVRASNTEPIMRLIAEAPTAAEADRVLDGALDVIGTR